MSPFGSFLGPFSPKYGSILLKFRAEVVSYKTKEIFLAIFQNFVFKQKRDVLKVYSFGPCLGPIYPWKMQTIAKSQFFCKNYILRTMK